MSLLMRSAIRVPVPIVMVGTSQRGSITQFLVGQVSLELAFY
jgi:hypothetical protein